MKKLYRRSISGLMALLICFTTILGGGITAFAASSSGEVAKSYSIGFPRSGDANLDYSGTWGHDELHYMNGWTSGEATWMTTLHTIGSFDGPACYCIEPGVPRLLEKTYTRYGEDYWKNYPSDYNSTIDADTIKTLLGRIMQYGYQGDLSLDWRSQNEADADKMAHMMATQVLVWETVVGERDANFNHVDPGSADAVKSMYRTAHPLYSRFSAYYDSIEASVQSHTVIPSFMSKTPNKAQTVELKWDGSQYTATLTDNNHVVSDYTFSSNLSDIVFTTNGDTLTITAKTAPAEPVTISAGKNNIRKGVIVWSDGHYGPDGTMQDAVTYAATVMDPVQAFLNLKVSYGSAKIVKTSEDGKVDNLNFTVTGNGINQTVKTNAKGEIQIDNLMPGVYTVSEMDYDKYEPQESRRVTVVSGQVSTVTFNNKLKRGDLQIVKSSEDNLNEGVTFHLYGTSLSGIAVDEYAVTDENGVATFEDVLISGSTPYTVEEVDTAVRYVVPEAQSAPINWNEVTNRSFLNIMKKFSVTVTKSDAETGTAQGDASLAGAVYGIYKGETLVDTYTTDKNGQFVTKEYICDDDWTVREITPSEGYLLDTTVHKVGAEPQLYTVEHNQTANDVTEQVVKGNIAVIKHTDNGETQIETPESGAEFAVYLKAAGSYEVAEDTERDYLTCDENGFAQTKDMPYGIYTVHQVSGWEGSELMPDFDVFISQNGATYRYLINNAPFNSFIKIVKQDAETGKTIPYAGAGFKIYDPDGNPVTMTFTYPTPTTIDVFYTNAEGSLVTPEKLSFGKGYSIVEVQAPYGYVLDETPVYFDVTEDNSTEESGVTVVKVDKPNMAQKGTITVEKNGEVFFGVSVIGGIVLCEDSVKTVLVLLLCYGMGIGIYFSTRRNYRRREEHGSAKWGNAKAVDKKYRQNPPSENKLMTQAVRIGLNGKKHRRNLNTLVCGGSGAGKTRFYCKPNLMQANTSFVILDPKGEIVRDVGNLLEKKGYEIRVLDLISMEKSHCYNPFVYLHSDNDVQRLVTNLFKSTTPKGSQSNDPFWDTSASMLLSALVYYLHYEAPEDEQNFAMVMEMLQAAAIDNEEDPRPSPLDCLFADLELDRPDHIALKYYRSYHTGSAKTLKSIQITLAARLEKFNLESLAALTCTDELDLASMGEKKVALFAIIPDNDSSFNFLVSILYTQLFQQLFFSADHIHGGALPIPVHFLMDEFANVSLPDDFDKILSVMRSRGVFVSIILQNLAQLKALFEKQWESIVGNCDEFLYLGGNEQSTHKYVSELLGKETIDTNTYGKSSGRSGNYSTNYQISGRELLTPDEVRMLDNRYAILFIRGELPVMDLKYDILKHPAVDLTADGKGGVYQHGKVTSNVATIEVQYLDPDTLPDTEVSETTYELLSDEDFNSETTNNTTSKLRR